MPTNRISPDAGSNGSCRANQRTTRWLTVVLVAASLVATSLGAASVGAMVGVPSAGGDTVATLRSQAATISQQLVLDQLQIDADRQQASVATARLSADREQEAQLMAQIGADQHSIATQLHIVQAQAILSYINAGSQATGVTAAFFSDGSAVRAQTSAEYTGLATGTITADIARLHTAQQALQGKQAALRQQQAQDRAAQASQQEALDRASSAVAGLARQQAQVTGALAAAVAQQQTAQASAVAATVAHSSASGSGSTTTAGHASSPTTAVTGPAGAPVATIPVATAPGGSTSVAAPPSNLSDPPLNDFLQCVVQAESGGDYSIASPGGTYMGAFQFSQSTWNVAAGDAGLGFLVGVPPNQASKAEQDTVAMALYALDGRQPWLGDRCSA